MKILITGAAGFIGSHLQELMPDAHLLDRKPKRDKHHVYFQADIRDDLRDIIPHYDVIVHLAALTDVQESIQEPTEYWNVNVDGTNNILSHMRPHQKLVFASSCAAADPASPYARSKLRAEKIILSSGIPHAILRFYNVFGPSSKGVIAAFGEAAKHGHDLRIHGDGSQTRSFIHVEDIARAILRHTLHSVFGVIDVGGCTSMSILGLAQTVKHLMQSDSPIVHLPELPGELRHSVFYNPDYPIHSRLIQYLL